MTSRIEYETWNPVTGCSKVSQGCKYCYAERVWPRLSGNPKTVYYGREFTDVRCHQERLELPLLWKKPRRIFVNSMSDLFHPDVPSGFILSVLHTIAVAKQHTFQMLTKRPERMAELANGIAILNGGHIPNLWLGVSVEDQATADERIPVLLKTPAAVRWVSVEPLLDKVDLFEFLPGRWITPDFPSLDWVVVGGESGSLARPMHPGWVRGIRDQCQSTKVPFLFKQWGEWAPTQAEPIRGQHTGGGLFFRPDGSLGSQGDWWDGRAAGMDKVGKKLAGRQLDGVIHDEYPTSK